MSEKSFDCVEFQRQAREEALKKANYDIRTLIHQVNERLENSELNSFFIDRKDNLKHLTTA